MKLTGIIIAVLLVAAIVVLAALSATPTISMDPPVKTIGASTPMKI